MELLFCNYTFTLSIFNMYMNDLTEYLMIRDSITRLEAESLVKDTMLEVMSDPVDTEDIIEENLQLDIFKLTELLKL